MQIFIARSKVPAPSFTYFLDILVNTIRDEIAACMEKSFDKIHLSEAAKMLSITNINVMKDYGKKVNYNLIFHSPYTQIGFFFAEGLDAELRRILHVPD